jgi:hypothetical protein
MTSAIVDFEPYYGEQQLPYWYILPHFTYGMILLDFLTDDGIPKMAFKLLMPHDMRIVWFMNVFTIFVYFTLYYYLDAIVPNKYGIAYPPCFCCTSLKRGTKRVFCSKKYQEEIEMEMANIPNFDNDKAVKDGAEKEKPMI